MAAVSTARRKTNAAQEQKQAAQRRRLGGARGGAEVPAYLQRKLAVGAVGDAFETEADHAADRVVAARSAGPMLQRAGDQKQDQKKPDKAAQRVPADDRKREPAVQRSAEKKKEEPKKAGDAKVQKKEIDANGKIDAERKKAAPSEQQKAAPEPAEKPPAPHEQPLQKASSEQKGADQKREEPKSKGAVQKVPLAASLSRTGASGPAAGTVQRRSLDGGHAPSDVEHRVDAARGGGAPLPSDTRSHMESQFGTDFGGVRVHTGSEAESLASDLDARAFTVGRDVFFNSGAYAPETHQGEHLLAHELAHVVQQGGDQGGAQREALQAKAKPAEKKADSKPAGSVEGDTYKGPEGTLNKDRSKATIPEAHFPAIKSTFIPASNLKLRKKGEKRPNDQVAVWEKEALKGDLVGQKLDEKLAKGHAPKMVLNNDNVYYLQIPSGGFLLGSRKTIVQRLLRPYWDKDGKRNFFDVDHKNEYQTNGDHVIGNMWLLEASPNRSSGPRIDNEIVTRVEALLAAANPLLGKPAHGVEKLREKAEITIEKVIFDGEPKKPALNYELTDIQAGKQLSTLKVLKKDEIEKEGLQGSPKELAIFSNPSGGKVEKVKWDENSKSKSIEKDWLSNFKLKSIKYDHTAKTGNSITVEVFKNNKYVKGGEIPDVPLLPQDGVDWGGYVSSFGLNRKLSPILKAAGFSPITIEDVEIGPGGIDARGYIEVDLPILRGQRIDLSINGNDIAVSKTFTSGDFKFPGPIQVTGASLTVTLGTAGFGAAGQVLFEIEKVGKGRIAASALTKGKGGEFSLLGEFEVASELFDEAKVSVKYEKEKWSGTGDLSIKSGKLKGIKSAKAHVAVDGESWSAEGNVEPDMPGVESGHLLIMFDKTTGLTIAGDVALKKMTGIKSGKLAATVVKTPEGVWKVKASGDAEVDVPGLSASTLHAEYDDGAFLANAHLAYKRGMLDGAVDIGATNRPVDDQGHPAGDPGKDLTIFGGGALTLQIAPWLKGTVGIFVLPTGKLKVMGEVALPSALDIFPEKRLDKELFGIHIDIPILGVAAAGQRIGIFATIGGKLQLVAGFGPGQLRNVKVHVDYTPGEEEKTVVSGTAEFHVPAEAGLRLAVTGALGVGIPIVSATAGLEVGAFAGIQAEAIVATAVNWTPTTGLDLSGKAEAKASPKLKFDVTGFVSVDLDLWLTTINLYEKRWQLAAFEYGSGLELGMTMPLRYQEGKPFNPSLDDIQFIYPKIDPLDLLGGLVKQVV